MNFSLSMSALAFIASAIAQAVDFNAINTPESGELVPAGSVYPIKWNAPEKYQIGTVSIDLLAGDSPKTLTPAMNLAKGVENSAKVFDWSVDPSLGEAKTYGVKITLDSDPSIYQYSMPFQISSGAKTFEPECKETEEKASAPSAHENLTHSGFVSPKPSSTFRKLNLTDNELNANRTLFRAPTYIQPTSSELPESPAGPGESTVTAPSTGLGQHARPNLVITGAIVALFLF